MTRSLLAALLLLTSARCDCGSSRPRGDRDSAVPDAPSFDSAGRDGSGDTGPAFDPFDPANACGAATIETEQIPGSLLILFDKSGSMDDEVSGGRSKWDLATESINTVLGSVSDELSVGLLLFPSGGDCSVEATPQVPVAPLSTTRPLIASTLAGTGPGGSTPAFASLQAGYRYLDTLTTAGPRGLVLVSDGGETCDFEMRDAVMALVETERLAKGRLTFAVGMDYADNNLSTIAFNGGTPRVPGCLAECTSGSCLDEGDCGGAPCVKLIDTEPGFCSCENDSQCVMPQTCEPPPVMLPCTGLPPSICAAINADRCEGPANCCHYNAAASDFQAQFEAALDEIARRLLDSCVFAVPRGANPDDFDPNNVNVGVTFEGEERTVLRRGDDPAVDSWNYTDPTNESLIIQGPICDRLLMGGATVEIVLGCPTILI